MRYIIQVKEYNDWVYVDTYLSKASAEFALREACESNPELRYRIIESN